MSNRLVIEPTRFENLRSLLESSLGYRAYDDYSQTYDNTWEDIPDDDMEILKRVVATGDNTVGEMLENVIANEKGLCIGDHYYEWDEIKEILTDDDSI